MPAWTVWTWYMNYRQAWIAEMLRIYGFINREHLMRKFGLSRAQATHDLKRFLRTHPDRMRYNVSLKRSLCTDPPLSELELPVATPGPTTTEPQPTMVPAPAPMQSSRQTPRARAAKKLKAS